MPVYEAGRWPTGEPFYAMKLVSGRSLERVIEAMSSLAERLAALPHVLAVADGTASCWTDVSQWYWDALLGRTQGPWWAVTVAGHAE